MRNLLLLLFFSLPSLMYSQKEPLDREQWEQLKKEVEFKQTSEKKTSKKPNEDESLGSTASSGTTLNLGPLVQMVIIVLFIIFIVALLYSLLSNVSLRRGNKVIDSGVSQAPTSIEENFTKSNLEKWLQYALSQRDHYLVLRIHFLMILKNLENKGLILWKKDKTNWQYIQELDDHDLQEPFQELVIEFDKVWYGEKDYSDEALQGKISQFDSFKSRIAEK